MGDEQTTGRKWKACVTGGTGYMASLLIKHLLEKGYCVHTTSRDPDNLKKISQLDIDGLKIFRADLDEKGSFDEAVSGCDVVFHVATPVHFASQDPENDMIKPATQGTLEVLKACAKAQTVKRVVMTSSAAAVSINKLKEHDLVMDEERWSDVEFLRLEKPPTWGHPVSKTLAEKAAWKYAEENKINLITVVPSLMAGPSLTPAVPSSVCLAILHARVEDVVRAHIFLAEKESASGRYICCAVNTSVLELSKFLSQRYPQYRIPTDFGCFPAKAKLVFSSEKLVTEGFNFKYGNDESIEYFKKLGFLH